MHTIYIQGHERSERLDSRLQIKGMPVERITASKVLFHPSVQNSLHKYVLSNYQHSF